MGSRFAGNKQRFGRRSNGSVRTHRDTYGPPWGPLGAHGGPFPFFPIFGFWPWPRSPWRAARGGPWKVSVVARGEQSVPMEQKRHGHMHSVVQVQCNSMVSVNLGSGAHSLARLDPRAHKASRTGSYGEGVYWYNWQKSAGFGKTHEPQQSVWPCDSKLADDAVDDKTTSIAHSCVVA